MKNRILSYATILAIFTALISGFNNFLTKIAVTAVNNPIAYTTLKNGLVAIILIGIFFALRRWQEIKTLNQSQTIKLIAIGIMGGSIPFALFFTGLTQTSAVNAAFIHKTLFLWVLLLAIPFLKEKFTTLQWVGVGVIFAANLLVGGFAGFKYNTGELMILGATILWAIENIIAKIALKELSSLVVCTARMTLGSLLLLLVVIWQENVSLFTGLNSIQWGWTLVTGLLLFGYVTTWYTALKYAPATYVATILVSATLVTNILSAIFVTHTISTNQILSSILFITGTVLVIIYAVKSKEQILNLKNKINNIKSLQT